MVLLLDNFDSFTYNLVDYLHRCGVSCLVVRNNELTLAQIKKLSFEAIVLSPGPKTPPEAGIMMELIEAYYTSKPMLGICLGHQALGIHFGAELGQASEPVHGFTSAIHFSDHPLFRSLPSSIEVMRYHSLILSNLSSKEMQVIAQTIKGEIMAIVHKRLPIVGLQFHPESILTQQGLKMLANWLLIAGINKF